MKKQLFFSFMLISQLLFGQKVSFSGGYSFAKIKSSSITFSSERESSIYYSKKNVKDTFVVVKTKSRNTYTNLTNFTFKNGYCVDMNLAWQLGKSITFNSGLGIQYIDFQAINSIKDGKSEVLSVDTTAKNVYLNFDDVWSSGTVYRYRNQRSEISVSPGDNYKNIYLIIPFSLSYDLKGTNLTATLGGKFSTLLQGKKTTERIANTTEYVASEKTNWVTYSKVEEVKKVNNNINNIGLAAFAQLDYKYQKFGFNIQIAQNLTNIMKYNAKSVNTDLPYYYSEPEPVSYKIKPTLITMKLTYFLNNSKENK
jgi:hypothetical protein